MEKILRERTRGISQLGTILAEHLITAMNSTVMQEDEYILK
jgi:hypothetical protein